MKKWSKAFAVVTALCLVLQLAVPLAGNAAQNRTVSVAFPDFSNSTMNQLVKLSGQNQPAKIVGNAVSLTPDQGVQTGCAYYNRKVHLDANRDFSTFFTFRITPGTPAADGFAFVLNNAATDYSTCGIMSLGIPYLPSSVALEFDTYGNNGGYGDTPGQGQHLAFDLGQTYHNGGSQYDLGGMTLADGQLKYAWVEYDGTTLKATVSNSSDKSAGVVLSNTVNLRATLTSPDVYIGFTGQVYNSNQQHAINSWYFDNTTQAIDTSAASLVGGPTDVALTASPASNVSTNSTVSVTAKNYDGTPAANTALALSATSGTVPQTVTTDATGAAQFTFTNSDNITGDAVVTAVAPGGAFGTATLGCVSSGKVEKAITVAYNDFSGATLNNHSQLALTDDYGYEVGAAFYKDKITLGQGGAFSTFFSFQFTHASTPADGLTFTVAKDTNTFQAANGLGCSNIPNSFSVEFDTYKNPELPQDPSSDHIGLDINGSNASVQTLDLSGTNVNISDGSPKYAWINYDGAGTLTVTVSNSTDRTSGQTMTVTGQDLASVVGSSDAFVGFTASTGGLAEIHGLNSWYFNNASGFLNTSAFDYTSTLENGLNSLYITRSPVNLDNYFKAGTFTSTQVAGQTLPYRLYVPADYDPSKSYPMVLFLHGAGDRGSDNGTHYINIGLINNLMTDQNRSNYECIILAAQCPSTAQWVNTPWANGDYSLDQIPQSDQEKMLMELFDKVRGQYSVDQSRLYISGLSMGGFGTWDIIMRYPRLFAAAAPICGGADPSKAASLSHLAIWTFHGDVDHTVPVEGTRAMVAALQAANADIKYTEYPGVDHGSWVNAYDPATGLIEWMFAQHNRCTDTAVVDAQTKIENLPAAPKASDRAAITAARTAFDQLDVHQQQAVANADKLTTAEAALQQLDTDASGAVKQLITNLSSPITLNDAPAVQAARAAYDALDETQQNLVDNYETLTAAEKTIADLQQSAADADKAAAKTVQDMIENLPATITQNDASAVKAARTAYDKLTVTQQGLVDNYETLTAAEKTIADLQQSAADADKAAAKTVQDMIENLPATITQNDASAVKAARAAYDKLTVTQQGLVTNYTTLTKAEDALQKLNDSGNSAPAPSTPASSTPAPGSSSGSTAAQSTPATSSPDTGASHSPLAAVAVAAACFSLCAAAFVAGKRRRAR